MSLLKKSLGPAVEPQPLPAALTDEGELQLLVQPELILDSHHNKLGELEVLGKWQDIPDVESTWELAEKIKTFFPLFLLEGKVILQGEGIVICQEDQGQIKKITPF